MFSHDVAHLRGVPFISNFRNYFVFPLSKQCGPWSDTTFCDIWSGSALFAKVPYLEFRTLGTNWLNEPPLDKTNKIACVPQWRLGSAWASAQSESESSLSAWRKLGSSATHWVHSEDSDQTGQLPRLILVFAGRTCHFFGFVMRQLNCHRVVHIIWFFNQQSSQWSKWC